MTTKNARPRAMFIAGDPSLDFLNSIGMPADKVVEWLEDGEDLMTWLEQAALVPPEAAATIRANWFPRELDAVTAQARPARLYLSGARQLNASYRGSARMLQAMRGGRRRRSARPLRAVRTDS